MEWTMFDRGMVLLAMISGWLIVFVIYFILTRKSAIYWSKSEQQIKTRDGKCLWSRIETGSKFTKMFQRIETLSQKVKKLEKETRGWADCTDWREKCNEVIHDNNEVAKMSKCKICNDTGMVGQILPGQREFGGDASTYHEYPCPDCNPKKTYEQLEAENKRLKEALGWIIGACGEPKTVSNCPRCGRPTGIPAIVAHAKQALKEK